MTERDEYSIRTKGIAGTFVLRIPYEHFTYNQNVVYFFMEQLRKLADGESGGIVIPDSKDVNGEYLYRLEWCPAGDSND